MFKLSIITAIHNGLPMNRLFWNSLKNNTETPFQLIVIDNHSTDGSEEFFRGVAQESLNSASQVVYIRNEFNQPYPASQIQGMSHAQNDILCFLNNDIWMPKGWELPFLEKLAENPWYILSPSGQEAQPTQYQSKKLKSRWRKVLGLSQIWKTFLRKTEEERLWKSLRWMYGSLENFKNPTQSETGWMTGIKGDSVVCHRALPEKLGSLWEPDIEAADWHLYLKAASLNKQDPNFPLPRVLLSTYIHHFGRYSAKQVYEPFKVPIKFRTIEEVWGKETVEELWWGNYLPHR